ncbi:MAG: hypothetical protein AB3N23_16895 [Paracoccaceae bacterium]
MHNSPRLIYDGLEYTVRGRTRHVLTDGENILWFDGVDEPFKTPVVGEFEFHDRGDVVQTKRHQAKIGLIMLSEFDMYKDRPFSHVLTTMLLVCDGDVPSDEGLTAMHYEALDEWRAVEQR